MAPLFKPTECSLLVLDSAGEPGPKDHDADVVAGRNRILQAAVLCGIPSFLAVRDMASCRSSGTRTAVQLIGARQLGETDRIASVRLYPVAGLLRNERGSHHQALVVEALEQSV